MTSNQQQDPLPPGALSRRAFLASAATPSMLSQNAKPGPPNVILIVGDDLGYADLGCYGQKEIRTPHIDSLAKDGLRFTQVYAGCTVCAPSRCCLMTGRHTGHGTVRGNRLPNLALKPEETTVAQIFQRAGYRGGAFGKWGLGTPPDMHALPTRKGFDTFYGYLHQTHAHTYYPDMLWDNEREVYIEENFSGGRKKYSHDLITDRALRFLDENHNRRFFLYAPFTPPHGRFEAPNDEPYSDRPWPPVARLIAAMVTRLDNSVGQILERLRRYGIERDTLVLFTSDNGPGGVSARQFQSSGPLRGFKRDMYEGGIRVPFIARWLGRIQPGVSEEVFASWDFLPTMAELTGQKAPGGLDGVSVLKALLGEGPAPNADRHFYWEFHEKGFQQAVRWRKWKGIRLKQGEPIEVYDLEQDPGERKNLASAEPAMARKLTALIDSSRTPSPYWPAPPGSKEPDVAGL